MPAMEPTTLPSEVLYAYSVSLCVGFGVVPAVGDGDDEHAARSTVHAIVTTTATWRALRLTLITFISPRLSFELPVDHARGVAAARHHKTGAGSPRETSDSTSGVPSGGGAAASSACLRFRRRRQK